jgi:phosphopantothenoylcysteine decarboxylase/phosphopantothenate--cysteine ligase
MASLERIGLQLRRAIGPWDLKKTSVLIIGGGTAEQIDDVRMLCNRSSGTMAVSLVTRAYERGADVEFWYGHGSTLPPEGLDVTYFSSIQDVMNLLDSHDMGKYDIIVVCAALSDFLPKKKQGKLSSDHPSLELHCTAAPKVLPLLKKKASDAIIVGFKLESDESQLLDRAEQMKEKYDIDFVIANTIKAIDEDTATIWIINGATPPRKLEGAKYQLADGIYDTIRSRD